ncbi:MAG: hypothetical protein AUJ18_11010 [Candidatus Hydrogenedentes bacterium CG1_02_42_14]|nr:MAG: hypothetical protein AUJ18_11010 [Candidatus Hydrogenedentes bacterium CG1_02_42_14]
MHTEFTNSKYVIITDEKDRVLWDRIEIAETFFLKLKGLMFRKKLEHGEGLLLLEVSSIHMCFMRFPIDAIFLDRDFRVKQVFMNLKPWTGFAIADAAHVLELPSGSASGLEIGMQIRLRGHSCNSTISAPRAGRVD